jgi:hypothetical protein
VLVEHVEAVERGEPRRLDQQMRPRSVGRVVGKVEALGDARGREGEVALRVGRHRPHVVVPHADAERVDPVGVRRREVVVVVLAAPDLEQLRAELTAVEAVAALAHDVVEGAGHARTADDRPGADGSSVAVVVRAGDVEDVADGRGQQR